MPSVKHQLELIMKIKLSNQIDIETTPSHERKVIEQFTFANPKYQEAQSFGRSTHGIDRFLYLVEQSEAGLIAPIGILNYLLQVFKPDVIDQRTTALVAIPFAGTLRPYQETFIDKAIKAKCGQQRAVVKQCVALH